METKKIFNAKENIMSALSSLNNEKDAKQWYKEYLEYHNGIDQGIAYMIGYFADANKQAQLNNWFYGN